MKRSYLVIFLITVIAAAMVIIYIRNDASMLRRTEKTKVAPEAEESFFVKRGNELAWERSYGIKFSFSANRLPAGILDLLEKAILFAYTEGAAREISEKDLDHAHALFYDHTKENPDVADADGFLLHTQELVSYSQEHYRKRNIHADYNAPPKILPCNYRVYDYRGGFILSSGGILPRGPCTVYPADLNMMGPFDVNFINADAIPEKDLAPYSANIRMIRGQKILFGLPEYYR